MRIYIEELDRYVSFVDRVAEVEWLLRVVEKGTAFPVAIYGPEGCGKTALLRYVSRRVSGLGDTVVVYVDALEQFDLERALFSSHREVLEVVRDLVSVPIGAGLARVLMGIVARLAKRVSLRGRNVVVMVDDVYRAIGLDYVDRYTKSLYEWIGYLHERYGVGNTAIILSTSEGVSKRVLSRHTYVDVELLWNLPRDGFAELVEQLNPPHSVDAEELWMLTGGNPRALIEVAHLGWDTRLWMDRVYEARVRRVLHVLERGRLEMLVEDPDSDWEMAERLEELGLMIELRRSSTISRVPGPSPELGIGRVWAWQLPIYRNLVKQGLESAKP